MRRQVESLENRIDGYVAEVHTLKQEIKEGAGIEKRYQSIRETGKNTRLSQIVTENGMLISEENEKKYLLMVQRNIIP